MKQPDLILFAKQPLSGQVKTRLQPEYSPDEAAAIAAQLICGTVELAVSTWPGQVYLYAWPNADHPLFHELAREFHIQLAAQADGDLGAKMLSVLQAHIAHRGCAAILGCDVPHCDWDIIDQANDWLARGRNVLGPTYDGGYYFIGLQQPAPELFTDIEWSSNKVLTETLLRAGILGIDFEMLSELRDIDTPGDLWLVAQKYEPLKRYLK